MMTKLMIAGAAMLALGVAVTTAGTLGYMEPGQDDASSRPGQQKTYRASPRRNQPAVNTRARESAREWREERNHPSQAISAGREVIKRAAARDGEALSLAISPNGKTLAAGCTDSSVQLLDARTGEKRVALAGSVHGYIRALAFTPDGKTIAGVCDDNRLRLWDVASGQLMKALPALGNLGARRLTAPVPNSLAISPDGSLIAVGGAGCTGQCEDEALRMTRAFSRSGSWTQRPASLCGRTLAGGDTWTSSPSRPTATPWPARHAR